MQNCAKAEVSRYGTITHTRVTLLVSQVQVFNNISLARLDQRFCFARLVFGLRRVWLTFCIVLPLQAVAELRKDGLDMNFSFLNYAQSSECRNWQDSSVSYAAGALIVH